MTSAAHSNPTLLSPSMSRMLDIRKARSALGQGSSTPCFRTVTPALSLPAAAIASHMDRLLRIPTGYSATIAGLSEARNKVSLAGWQGRWPVTRDRHPQVQKRRPALMARPAPEAASATQAHSKATLPVAEAPCTRRP